MKPNSTITRKFKFLAIKDLFDGKQPAIPLADRTPFKKAETETREKRGRYLL
jgi:hypothetical protein